MQPAIRPTCTIITPRETYHGKQNLDYFSGLSAGIGGIAGPVHAPGDDPPLGARAHLHENHESAIYVLTGEAGMWFGEGLLEHVWARAGDFLYIPANVPHLPYNASPDMPCRGLIARTDPNEQESVTVLDLPDPGVAPR